MAELWKFTSMSLSCDVCSTIAFLSPSLEEKMFATLM